MKLTKEQQLEKINEWADDIGEREAWEEITRENIIRKLGEINSFEQEDCNV